MKWTAVYDLVLVSLQSLDDYQAGDELIAGLILSDEERIEGMLEFKDKEDKFLEYIKTLRNQLSIRN